jgi:hypothetical protein
MSAPKPTPREVVIARVGQRIPGTPKVGAA